MPFKRYASPPRAAHSWLPIVVIALGIALSLWLQLFTKEGVFFSGDGGLKALVAQSLAQQIKAASFPLDVSLNLPAADWVEAVWQEGLYPFLPPFAYEVGPQHFITFPFTFPLVSAPFYALLGEQGLYVVPLVSLWLIWLRFWQIGLRASWSVTALCVGLVALIFASPLSLYGGMYWEHTLSVAIAFWGLSALLFPRNGTLSKNKLLGSGFLIGLAVWFRPEFLCLVAALSLLAIIGWLFPKWRLAPQLTFSKTAILIGSMICSVGLFFALNYGIYGHPLGIHAIQIVEESGISEQLTQAKASYAQLLTSLQQYFPIVWVVGLAAIFSPELRKSTVKINPLKNNQLKENRGKYFDRLGLRKTVESKLVPGRFALALSLLFALSVPLIVPPGAGGKQWGPRFYLILMPLLSVVLAEQLRPDFFRAWGRRLLLLGTAIALVFGIHLNTVSGAFEPFKDGMNTSIQANYEPIAPAIAALKQDPLPWVAMSHQYVAQQLWSALPNKTFFRAETIEQVKQLAGALIEQSEPEFLYVCYPHADCLVPDTAGSELNLEDDIHTLNWEFLGDYGKYPTYKVDIAELSIAKERQSNKLSVPTQLPYALSNSTETTGNRT
ncbi:MAG: hypothetical protein AAFO84_00665 [Cyanobacteria bacterium J06598_1]